MCTFHETRSIKGSKYLGTFGFSTATTFDGIDYHHEHDATSVEGVQQAEETSDATTPAMTAHYFTYMYFV